MNLEKLNKSFNIITIAVFFSIIFAPCTWMIYGPETVFSYTEKRQLAVFPQFPDNLSGIRKFFSDTDSYLNDHFGFREWMVYRYQREVKKRFDDVERITKVMKGLNNWYFFTGDSMLKDFAGRHLRRDSKLNEWLAAYRAKQRWIEKQGIRYLLITPPNKMTVYGELLGDPWISQRGLTRLSQLKNSMQESDKSTFLDLSPSLIGNAEGENLYFKSDTHWTQYGAYIGYLAIAERLESLFPSTRFKRDFTFSKTMTRTCEKEKNNCGDLTTMVLDYDRFQESFRNVDEFANCAVSTDFKINFTNIDTTTPTPYIAKSCPSGELRALVFRDSFFESLEPYLSENFREIIYLWKGYDQNNIEELLSLYKPDIVIEEKAERAL